MKPLNMAAATAAVLVGNSMHMEVTSNVGLDRQRLAAGVAQLRFAVERVVDPPRSTCGTAHQCARGANSSQ